MNHRRNRATTRHEDKRMDRHKLRAAERDALNGAETRVVPLLDWSSSSMNRDVPLINEEGRHKKRSKRRTAKKRRCPVNGRHEWQRKIVEEKDFVCERINGPCDKCEFLKTDWERMQDRYRQHGWPAKDSWSNPYTYSARHGCLDHGPTIYYTRTLNTRTCLHCGEYKIDRQTDDNPLSYERRLWRNRRHTTPKREVVY